MHTLKRLFGGVTIAKGLVDDGQLHGGQVSSGQISSGLGWQSVATICRRRATTGINAAPKQLAARLAARPLPWSLMLGGLCALGHLTALGAISAANAAADVGVQAQLIATLPGASGAKPAANASVHYDEARQEFLIVNRHDRTIDQIALTGAVSAERRATIDLKAYGARLMGLAVGNAVWAAIMQPPDATKSGTLLIISPAGKVTRTIRVGAGPKMVTFTPDRSVILVANEGAPSRDYRVDPEGTVSLIKVADWSVRTVRFDNIIARVLGSSIHLPSPLDTTIAQDLEPEHIAVAPNGAHAFVTLQENNAVAVIEMATATVTRVIEAGLQDYRRITLDGSDKDGRVRLTHGPIFSFRQPAQVASYTAGDATFFITTNQGAPRNLNGYVEEKRLRDLVLDPKTFGGVATAPGPAASLLAAGATVPAQKSTPAQGARAASLAQFAAQAELPNEAQFPDQARASNGVGESGAQSVGAIDAAFVTADLGSGDFSKNDLAKTGPSKTGPFQTGPSQTAPAAAGSVDTGSPRAVLATPGVPDTIGAQPQPDAPWRAPIQADDAFGRLLVSTVRGDHDADGDHDALYAFGGRSFSIFAMQGDRVFDSGDELARVLSGVFPAWFNSSGTTATFDQHSPARGVEPRALAIGTVAGRSLAFIGLRAMGGVVVYDITDPQVPRFLEYLVSNRPEGSIAQGTAGDIGPSWISFVPATASSIGIPILAVANTGSNTTSLFALSVSTPRGSALGN